MNQQTETGTALALIEEMQNDRKAAGRFHAARINTDLKFKAECHYAHEIVKASNQLQKALPETVRECIEDVSLLGLSLSPNLAHCYLVPRFIKGRGMVCTLYTSWRGLTVAARKWGGLLDMTANVVYANEPFEIEQGTSPSVRHKVVPNAAARGPLVGAYCVAYMQGGIIKVEYMDRDQIDRARAVSESKDSAYSPWNKWFEEMARKTVVRRASKHWSGTPEMQSSISVQQKYEGMGWAVNDEVDEAGQATTIAGTEAELAFHAKLVEHDLDADKVLNRVATVMGVERIDQITTDRVPEAEEWIQKAISHKQQAS